MKKIKINYKNGQPIVLNTVRQMWWQTDNKKTLFLSVNKIYYTCDYYIIMHVYDFESDFNGSY